MSKMRNESGGKNLSGKRVKEIRLSFSPKLSQRKLADMLQLNGIDLDRNAIRRIESGERYVTDIELVALVKVLKTDYEFLLEGKRHK